MVGNGATNWYYDVFPSFAVTAYNFNIITKDLKDAYEDNNCLFTDGSVIPWTPTQICLDTADSIEALTNQLNWYDLYRFLYPDTINLSAEDRWATAEVHGETKHYRRGFTHQEYTPWANQGRNQEESPILGDYLSGYMNREDVRDALHIPTDVQAWEECSYYLNYQFQEEASQWIYPIMKQQGLRMMFYSGDTDGAVPTWGTKQWIAELDWPIVEAWRPWYTHGQVSGYTEEYDGLRFVTVKGVGHMAPQWAREPVMDMITSWVHNETF